MLFRSGKNIDFKFFQKEGFSIGSKIKNQGWKFYCLLKENTYIDLVRKFYLNLSYYNGIVKSLMKGVNIVLDPLHLGQILHLPCEGYTHMELSIKEEGLSAILGRVFTENLNKLEVKILSVEMRLLHHMVTKLFVPRSARYDLLSGRNICIMYHVITQTPLNLQIGRAHV